MAPFAFSHPFLCLVYDEPYEFFGRKRTGKEEEEEEKNSFLHCACSELKSSELQP